ncbi:MAG TPA: methyltransferase domain-containing protein [Micromonosporaceae bacterium]|nr:methyltransferase domain-containing protein [Micromonosporaceae bacterium]
MYMHGHHESVLRSHRWRTAENSAAYLLPYLSPGMSLLDVGAGPGSITADLAALVAPGAVTALEASAEVLAITEAGIAGRGVTGVDFVVGDVHAMDLPDGAYDVVHAHQVLQHVADPVRALAEMRRVCRPGGVVAARDGDYDGFVWYPRLPELDEWMALYQRVARRNGGEPDAGRRLLSWALAAGFSDVTPSVSSWLFATPEDRAFWGGMWADRVVGSDFARQAVDAGLATTGDLARISRAWLAWAEASDGWLALPNGEILCRA